MIEKREIAHQINSVKEELAKSHPQAKRALELLTMIFTKSGGEALAHNKKNPEDKIQPSESVTVNKLFELLQDEHSLNEEQANEILPHFQEWYGIINQLSQNEKSWKLLHELVNLYHAMAGVKPISEERLKESLASLFLRGLKEKLGFDF